MNAFKGRFDKKFKVPGITFKKSIVKTYKLVNKAKFLKGSEDGVIVCEPVLEDEFDVQKTINENARGHSIKDVAARVLMGDTTICNNNIAYGDGTSIPEEKIEILKAHNDISSTIANLSDEEYSVLKKTLKMSDKEILDLVNSKKVNTEIKQDVIEPVVEENKTEKGEN